MRASKDAIELKHSVPEDDWSIVRSESPVSESKRARANAPLALLIEPGEEDRDLLESELGGAGYEVMVADNSVDALKLSASHRFGVVVSDVEVRPVNGFELVKRIRRQSGNEVPFAIVTRNASGTCEKRSFEVGASEFIDLSLSPGRVAVKLRRMLKEAARGR
jgi:CheY-like chemotaxis protein